MCAVVTALGDMFKGGGAVLERGGRGGDVDDGEGLVEGKEESWLEGGEGDGEAASPVAGSSSSLSFMITGLLLLPCR